MEEAVHTEIVDRFLEHALRDFVKRTNTLGVVVTDRDGRVLEVDEIALAIVGLTRAEVLADDFRWTALFPRSTPEEDRRLRELELRRPDGSSVWLLKAAVVLADEPYRRASFLIDVTVRKRGEAVLEHLAEAQAAEARFRGFVESAPDAVVIVDPRGQIVLVNAQTQAWCGYQRDELVGRSVDLLVPQRLRSRHPSHRERYASAPKARPMGAGFDLFGVRKDGTEFPAEVSLSPLHAVEGTLVAASVRDVTEQKQRKEDQLRSRSRSLEDDNRRMQEANRLKSEFLANMSHELRTPLNAIIGFADLMHKGKVGPVSADHEEYLGDILTSSRHLLQLINDVLDLSKVESGKMEFRPEPLDLSTVVGEVRDVLRGLAAAKRIRMEMELASLPAAWLDAAKLKQVLYNFLSNAIKFTPERGRVVVRLSPDGEGHFRLEVEDSGIGIRPDQMHLLFVEFQQLDGGSGKKYAGTGLGLSLTKRIVEAQGGTVGATSTLGAGSRFWAILPLSVPGGDER